LEQLLKDEFENMLINSAKNGVSLRNLKLEKMISLIFYLAKNNWIDEGLLISIFNDIFETVTIDVAEDLFQLLENIAEEMTKLKTWNQDKEKRLVGVCCSLLKRLSKIENTVIRGRVLMLLTVICPLSHKSGLNSKGLVNVSNVTTIEEVQEDGEVEKTNDAMDIETEKNDSLDVNFYKLFWGIQQFFQNPDILYQTEEKWNECSVNLDKILLNLETGINQTEGQGSLYFDLNQVGLVKTLPKYLTNKNLLKMELKDPSFRRYILVQILIFCDRLINPLKDNQKLNEKQLASVNNFQTRSLSVLEKTGNNGKKIYRKIKFDNYKRKKLC